MPTDLKIAIEADVARFERGMDRAVASTGKYEDSLRQLEIELMKIEKELDDDVARAFERQEAAAAELGKGMLAAGTAIAAGLALAANEAIKWESAWAGVEKVTDGSPAQMAALEEELRNLAKTLPATHDEIAAVAEAAGQLGVKRKDVAEFTEVMIAMGVSTNLTADEAATSMARFANIMGMPIEDVQRLGSAIVALGNDGASTEAEIVAMALRIAGAGRTVGLTEANVLALANALSSVGIEAEAGGSAISTVMVNIDKAVASGEDKLESFARVAGVSADEFAARWRSDPAAALLLFEQGLANVQASGANTFQVLEELGITEIRQRDAVLRLSGATDILKGSIDTGNKSWEENAALMTEANKRYETTASKMQIAQNQLADFAISLGEQLLPIIGQFAESASGILDFFNSLPGPVKTGIVVLGTIAAVIGVVGGAALLAAPKIRAAKEALTEVGGAGGLAKKGLGAVSSVLFGPWGLAIAGATAALGYFATQHAESQDRIRAHIDALDEETGALTESNRAVAAKALEDSKALAAAESLGISLDLVTDAALGNADAQKELDKQLDAVIAGLDDSGSAALDNMSANLGYEGSVQTVRDAVSGQNEEVATAIERYLRLKGAVGEGGDATEKAGGQAADASRWLENFGEVSADTADDVDQLAKDVDDLRDSIQLLNEGQLNSEEAAIAFRESIRSMAEDVKANKENIDGWTSSLKGNTAASDANKSLILERIEAAREDAEAVFDVVAAQKGNEAAVLAVNGRMRDNINTLITEATQLGLNKEQVKTYVANILGIPVDSVTKYMAPGLDAQLARARELDAQADDLDGRKVTTTWTQKRITELITRISTEGRGPLRGFGGATGGEITPFGFLHMAGGGDVSGPGGPRDDLIPAMLSNGEFVSDADSTSRNRDALFAGNAGATLVPVGSFDLSRFKHGGRIPQTFMAGQGRTGNGGVYVENLNLRAYSDRFSTQQVMDDLAMHGAT